MSEKSTGMLRVIAAQTLGHYNGKSEQFWQGTKDHDVKQNINALLDSITSEPPHHILDFGCGPGRDLISFKALGHNVTGLDGCENFVSMAKNNSKCEVLHQNFLELSLPKNEYDGIFANASIFHIPSEELERVLKELHASLKKGGILFSSNPRGATEGWTGDRWSNCMELKIYESYLKKAGFKILDHFYRPTDMPIAKRPWLAIVAISL